VAAGLYVLTAFGLLLAWSRLQRISVGAAIALIALPLIPTGRALLTGRTLAPVDISFMARPLRDYARDYGLEQTYNLALSDLHCQMVPWQKAIRYSLAHGQWPLWNPFVLAGDVLAGTAQSAVYDPWNWLAMPLGLADAFSFQVALTFFLAGFFAFAFARELELREVAALTVASGFVLSGSMAFFAGWPLGRTWAYLPLVLFATHRLVHRERAGLLTTAFVLVIVAGHPESVLHVVACGAAYGAFELARARRMRPMLLGVGAGLVALLLTAVYLLPFLEAAQQTLEYRVRHDVYARSPYNVSMERQLARLQQSFVPGARTNDAESARVGPLLTLLALAGIFVRRRDRRTWFFVALTIVSLGALFGSWPFGQILHALPLFDLALNERLGFAAGFGLALLAGFAVDAIASRRVTIAVAILAAALLERTADDGRLYPAIDKSAFFPRLPVIAAIPRDARMTAQGFVLTPNNPTMYGLEDVRGYTAMTNLRLSETWPMWSVHMKAYYNRVDDLASPFLSFLNVRYVVTDEGVPEGWRLLHEDRRTRVLENSRELPRAFIPPMIRFERDPNVVLEAMKGAADFANVAWIETSEVPPGDLVNGRGVVTPRRIGLAYELDVSMENAGWVIVSATAWKGWRVYIDGQRIRTYIANHAFLGVYVPQGTHRVSLRYLPESFTRGRTISLVTALVLAVGGIRRRRLV
jgi:hypothetical protein